MSSKPFFIVGSPRSGTTMLRDILKGHDNLFCPEESHFYRWAHPFKSKPFLHSYTKNQTLIKHREIDGVSEETFKEIYRVSRNRKELQDAYMACFLEAKGAPDARWFDKTPQNSFGCHLLAADYPGSKFIHIVRNPLNVVASLKKGVIIKEHNFLASVNHWLEPVKSLIMLQKLMPKRVMLIKYEELIETPKPVMQQLFDFIEEPVTPNFLDAIKLKKEQNKYKKELSEREIKRVINITRKEAQHLGYDNRRGNDE